MVPINPVSPPQILTEKAEAWTKAYLAKVEAYEALPVEERKQKGMKFPRPSTSQYGHEQIESSLCGMSNQKCFYSEMLLAKGEREIDHYIEVSVEPSKAFEWDNLYLIYHHLNGKKQDHFQVPVEAAINPKNTSYTELEDCLEFERERLHSKNERGLKTIQKFRLNDDSIAYARSKMLTIFLEKYISISERMKTEGRSDFSPEERQDLLAYANPDRPFSLMFRCQLKTLGLL